MSVNAKGRPEELWHYTSMGGLRGLLTTRQLRMTQVQYMNDPMELQQVFDAFEQRVMTEEGSFGEGLRDHASGAPRDEETWPFVASFSAEHDSLPMWLAYSGNRAGVALEIDIEAMFQLSVDDHQLDFVEVMYGPEHVSAAVAALVDPVRDSWNVTASQHPAGGSAGQVKQVRAIPDHLMVRASTYKPDGWSYEKEWRLVATFQGGTGALWAVEPSAREATWHYRDTCERYVVARFDPRRLIRSVKVGPCGDQESVQALLRELGLSELPVTRSRIAVRCPPPNQTQPVPVR